MTGQPWGRTGRVTLRGRKLRDVFVDGHPLGWADGPFSSNPHVYAGFFDRQDDSHSEEFGPNEFDHAVMWVLRRARPDVWRAERPVVVRVLGHTYRDVPDAVSIAHRLARAEYTVKAYR